MEHPVSFNADAEERWDRPVVALPCTVLTDGATMQAVLRDIGHGGVGLILPPDGPVLAPGDHVAVVAEPLGTLKVEIRWLRGDRAGAQFLDEDAASPVVVGYLSASGIATA